MTNGKQFFGKGPKSFITLLLAALFVACLAGMAMANNATAGETKPYGTAVPWNPVDDVKVPAIEKGRSWADFEAAAESFRVKLNELSVIAGDMNGIFRRQLGEPKPGKVVNDLLTALERDMQIVQGIIDQMSEKDPVALDRMKVVKAEMDNKYATLLTRMGDMELYTFGPKVLTLELEVNQDGYGYTAVETLSGKKLEVRYSVGSQMKSFGPVEAYPVVAVGTEPGAKYAIFGHGYLTRHSGKVVITFEPFPLVKSFVADWLGFFNVCSDQKEFLMRDKPFTVNYAPVGAPANGGKPIKLRN